MTGNIADAYSICHYYINETPYEKACTSPIPQIIQTCERKTRFSKVEETNKQSVAE